MKQNKSIAVQLIETEGCLMQLIAYLKKWLSGRSEVTRSTDAEMSWRDVNIPQSWAAVRSTHGGQLRLLAHCSLQCLLPSSNRHPFAHSPLSFFVAVLRDGGGYSANSHVSTLYTVQCQYDR